MSNSHDLVECEACARHAFARDRACPFCGAPLPASAPERPRWLGPMTRAAIFYGASSLAAMGCGEPELGTAADPQKTAPQVAEVAPEPEASEPSATEVVAVEPEPVAIEEDPATLAAERAHAESRKRRVREEAERQRRQRDLLRQLQQHRRIAMPYGAPPFDFVV